MAASEILTSESASAVGAAQGVLCVLAGISAVGALWALGQPTPLTGDALPSKVVQKSPGTPLASYSLPPALPQLLPTSGGSTSHGNSVSPASPPSQFTLPNLTPTISTAPADQPSVPAQSQLKDPAVIQAVATARVARASGDNASALDSLRGANLREPNHPEILGELALTYENMGLPSRAQGFWKNVLQMGEAKAGGYFVMARQRFEASFDASATLTQPAPVSLGECRVVQEPMEGGGERITVQVPVLPVIGATVDPRQIEIHVLLFEQINNGERIEQVRSEQPLQKWLTGPAIDWSDASGETIGITYELPAPTPEEIRDLGKRSFHGFTAKLFYADKLVGEQAEPPSLRNFTPHRPPPAELDTSLFPK